MTINQPCVSPGTGTLSPDLRVFYQYGMVLGLDDFLQEQTHTLARSTTTTSGRSTATGPSTAWPSPTSTPAGDAQDVEVTVGPGMGVDQWGREVTVEEAQCARIGAWLAAQEEAAPGTVEGYLGLSGELVLYVVAAYADCPDDLVPLPGQPCSTSAQVQVPSRLRDAWDIELRWAPPAMPAWEVIGQLAELLNSVQVVPGLNPSLSSEDELVEAVLALATPATPSGSPPTPPPVYQLPADDGRRRLRPDPHDLGGRRAPPAGPRPDGARPQLGSVDPLVDAHRHAAGALLDHRARSSSPTATPTTPAGPTCCRPS